MKHSSSLFFCFGIVLLSSFGCAQGGAAGLFGPSFKELAAEPFPMSEGFPLPADADHIVRSIATGDVSCQTSLSLEQILAMYRRHMTNAGLTEDPDITTVSNKHISIGFRGWPGGRILVIQSVDMYPTGKRSLSARLEYS